MRDNSGVFANYVKNPIFMLEATHVTARLKRILEIGRTISLPDEGASSRCKNTLYSRWVVVAIFDYLIIRHGEERGLAMRLAAFDLSFAL